MQNEDLLLQIAETQKIKPEEIAKAYYKLAGTPE